MRVLVGCETSGRVRRAFAALGPDRWKQRSVTFAGIASAMAEQWGGYALDRMEAAE
jgi:hypothetical protein